MSYYSHDELINVGFKHVGREVKLSRKASIYNAAKIEIGEYSRVDDFCVLSAGAGGISIGRNVHIAVYSLLIGAGRIQINDFANLSSRVSVYSSNDDYTGEFMTNPTVPDRFTNPTHAPATIGRHVIIGSGSIILPGVVIHEGCAIGALSLVKSSCDAWGIYVGAPVRRVGDRRCDLLRREEAFIASLGM